MSEPESDTLRAIDAAVKAHVKRLFDEDGTPDVLPIVTAWVVTFEVQSIEDGELIWDNSYAASVTTSNNTAVGLSTWLNDELRQITGTTEGDE